MNVVILMGNLTCDPELRYIPDGTAVCSFGIGVNERRTNREGEKQERADFFEIECWRQTAENVSKYMSKGSPVLLQGKLVQDRWQNKEGQNRSRIKVRAFFVKFLPRAQKRDDDDRGNREDEKPRGSKPEDQERGTDFDMPDDAVPF